MSRCADGDLKRVHVRRGEGEDAILPNRRDQRQFGNLTLREKFTFGCDDHQAAV